MWTTLLLLVAARAEPLEFDLGPGFAREAVDQWQVTIDDGSGQPVVRQGAVRTRWSWAENQDGTWHLFRPPGETIHRLPPDDEQASRLDARMLAPFDVPIQPDGSVALPPPGPWRDDQGSPDLPALLQPAWAQVVGRVFVGLDGVEPVEHAISEVGATTWRRRLTLEEDCPEVGRQCVVATWTRLLGGAPPEGALPVGGLREREQWWLDAEGLAPLRMVRQVETSWQPRRARQPHTASMSVTRQLFPPEPTPPAR